MGLRLRQRSRRRSAQRFNNLQLVGSSPGWRWCWSGDVPASEIYVRSKVKTCGELGIRSEMLTPPESVTTEEMLALVAELNAREDVDGILIQLPLPKHVDTRRLLEAVSPEKDVDGFHPINAGRLQSGQPGLTPCTPAGIMEILRRSGLPIAGQTCGGRGTVGHRGQAGGDDAAECIGDGDGVPQQDATICRVYPRRGHAGGGDWQAGICDRGDGEAGSDADRCGDQPGDGCGGGGEVLSRRCGAGGAVCQARLDAGGGYPSGGVCAGREHTRRYRVAWAR